MVVSKQPDFISFLRSLLFTPADRPERFAKALAAGADAVIFDWEDGVALDAKGKARDATLSLLADGNHGIITALRINRISTEAGLIDLLALRNSPALPQIIVLPKTESVAEIDMVLAHLPDRIPIAALIESAAGLDAATAIAAHPAVDALAFGGADLAADLGAELDWQPMLYARSRIVQASAAHGVVAWDVPFLDIADLKQLGEEARNVKALGFSGKLAIHPAQLSTIHQSFTPDAGQITKARRIVAAFEAGGGKVCVLDGRMIDAPIVASAQRTLAIIDHLGGPDGERKTSAQGEKC